MILGCEFTMCFLHRRHRRRHIEAQREIKPLIWNFYTPPDEVFFFFKETERERERERERKRERKKIKMRELKP